MQMFSVYTISECLLTHVTAGFHCTFSHHNYSRFALCSFSQNLQPVYTVHIYSWFMLFTPTTQLHWFTLYILTLQLQPVSTVQRHTTFIASLCCTLLHHNHSRFPVYTHAPQLQLVYCVHSYATTTAGLFCALPHHFYSQFTPQSSLTTNTAGLHHTLPHHNYSLSTPHSLTPLLQPVYPML